MGREIGVDPTDAMAAGGRIVEAGQQLGELRGLFREAVWAAQQAAVEPECAGGYPPFLDDVNSALTGTVQFVADTGGRVRTAGALAAQTDRDNAAGVDQARSALSRTINL